MPRIIDHEARRHELIAATWAVIAEDGFDAVTMRRVADAAGCTTGRITHYFADRDELLVAALRRTHDAAGVRMRAAISAESDPVTRLRAVLRHALPLDATSVAEWKVWIAFWQVAASDPRLAREDRRRYREWSDLLAAVLRGVVPPKAVDRTVAVLIATVDGLGIRGALHPSPRTRREITATLDAALAGLGVAA